MGAFRKAVCQRVLLEGHLVVSEIVVDGAEFVESQGVVIL